MHNQRLRVVILALVYCTAYCTTAYDVVVVGGTPGGVMSAVASARSNVSTLLLEPSEYIGGMMSSGLGTTDFGLRSDTIGGQAEEFFRRVAAYYNFSFRHPAAYQCSAPPHSGWTFEPHVAESIMIDMLTEAGVSIRSGARVVDAVMRLDSTGPRISAVRVLGDKRWTVGKVYVDATYEGSLMKLSGVTYTFGREASTQYNEPSAGRLPVPNTTEATGWIHGDIWHCAFKELINPYVDASNTTLIPGVTGTSLPPVGSADGMVGSLDWRLTMCSMTNEQNVIPIPAPSQYNPAQYELVRRVLHAGWNPTGALLPRFTLPGNKSDWKMLAGGDSLAELVGPVAAEYANATWERQLQIYSEYKQYTLGLLHFFKTDPSVPTHVQRSMQEWGLCRDEYNRSGHWPGQLYVREALRMVSDVVLTEHDVVATEFQNKSDVIGLGAYTVDVPGPAQRVVVHGRVVNEGSIKVPYFCDPKVSPYALPYAIMTPREGEASNLLVPVAVSASHIGFNSIRMEPQWMILGSAAGMAAAMAVQSNHTVRDIPIVALQAKLRAGGQTLDL